MKHFAYMFQSIMIPSNLSLSVGCATHPDIREMTRETWSFHLPRSESSPTIFSWMSSRCFDVLLTKHVCSFDRGTADTWRHIHVSQWPQCGWLAWKVWAGDLTSSGDAAGQWAGTLPALAGSTHSSYSGAEMPFCGRGDWNGSQTGVGNLTHPKPVPGAAGTADRHCPAGCGAGRCPLNTGRSRQGNTGHWGLNQILTSLWSSNRGIETKAKLARSRPQTAETYNVFPRYITHLKERQKWVKDTASPRKKSHATACGSDPAEQVSGGERRSGASQSRRVPRNDTNCTCCLSCTDLSHKQIPPTPLGTRRLHPDRRHRWGRSTEVPRVL